MDHFFAQESGFVQSTPFDNFVHLSRYAKHDISFWRVALFHPDLELTRAVFSLIYLFNLRIARGGFFSAPQAIHG